MPAHTWDQEIQILNLSLLEMDLILHTLLTLDIHVKNLFTFPKLILDDMSIKMKGNKGKENHFLGYCMFIMVFGNILTSLG